MAGEMSAHTGVGVTALAAPSFRVETELIAAQPAVLGESTTDMGLKRWNIGDFSNLAQAVEVPAGYKLLFTSGLVGQRKDGTLPETPSEQCTQVRFVWLAFNHSCLFTVLSQDSHLALSESHSEASQLVFCSFYALHRCSKTCSWCSRTLG